MKKNIITAGVLAASVASLYAENVSGLTEVQSSKPWTVSGSMRGFYDSNPNLQHSNPDSSWGMSFIPSVDYVRPLENSLFTLNLTYTAWWYESRPDHNWDQQFQATARFNHQFSEVSALDVQDSFLYTDQPAVSETGTAQGTFIQKSETSYIRNYLPIRYNTKFSERFGIAAGYQNTWYDYLDSVNPTTPVPYSSLLNRVEQLINLDLDYYLREQLVLLGGYQLGWNKYLSDDVIGGTVADPITGEDRSNVQHYFYAGVQNAFSTKLKASLKLGAVYTDWYELDQNDWSPYLDGSVSYNYLPGSWVRGGITVSHNATDVIAAPTTDPNDITLDQDSLTLYLGITHAITSRLMLNLLGQAQFSKYQGGLYDGDVDDYWVFGASVKYLFSKNFFTEAGYNYDGLSSDVQGRSFVRNRVYIGAGVTY